MKALKNLFVGLLLLFLSHNQQFPLGNLNTCQEKNNLKERLIQFCEQSCQQTGCQIKNFGTEKQVVCKVVFGDGILSGDEACDLGPDYVVNPKFGNPCVQGKIQEGWDCNSEGCKKEFVITQSEQQVYVIRSSQNSSIIRQFYMTINYRLSEAISFETWSQMSDFIHVTVIPNVTASTKLNNLYETCRPGVPRIDNISQIKCLVIAINQSQDFEKSLLKIQSIGKFIDSEYYNIKTQEGFRLYETFEIHDDGQSRTVVFGNGLFRTNAIFTNSIPAFGGF